MFYVVIWSEVSNLKTVQLVVFSLSLSPNLSLRNKTLD